MLVMKFGGTSVGSADALRQVAAIVVEHRDRRPVVVTSAMAGVTDLLLALVGCAGAGDHEACSRALAELDVRHWSTAQALAPAGDWSLLHQQLAALREAVAERLASAERSGDQDERIVAMGELLAVLLVTGALTAHGQCGSACLEPLVVMGSAVAGAPPMPDLPATRAAASAFLRAAAMTGPASAAPIPVIPGFICRTREGRLSTLGRGGSDYSATILAAALGCDACWIYTDVDGIFSADPRIVPEATALPRVSAATAGRLSFCGAKVLHPRSVAPAARAGFELRVRSTFFPHRPGTLIERELDSWSPDYRPQVVTGRGNLSLLTLGGYGIAEIPNLFARFCRAVFAAGVEIVQSPHPVPGHDPQVIVDSGDSARLSAAVAVEFAAESARGMVGNLRVEDGLALCSVIGEESEGMVLAVRAHTALEKAAVTWRHEVACAGLVSFVVSESMLHAALRALHAELVVGRPDPDVAGNIRIRPAGIAEVQA